MKDSWYNIKFEAKEVFVAIKYWVSAKLNAAWYVSEKTKAETWGGNMATLATKRGYDVLVVGKHRVIPLPKRSKIRRLLHQKLNQ